MKFLQSNSLDPYADDMDWNLPSIQYNPSDASQMNIALRNYLLLTFSQSPAIVSLDFSDRFICRYRWLLEFVERKKIASGPDAGLDQMVFQLIEEGTNSGEFDQWSIIEGIQGKVLKGL